jgi:hypothetical protein
MSGSGGGGGYQYQAQATAYIATHILAKRPLQWIEHLAPDVPIAVAEETDGPGDDIRITLQDDLVIELQAKHGLKKNEKFWEALTRLIRGLADNSLLYGVLLTDSTASSTIRDELREDIIRLGQGREDNLKTITQEVRDKLRKAAVLHSSDIFRRLRIVIADLDDSQRDAKTALVLLSQVLQNPKQTEQAWKVISDDALDLITKRGQRDAESLSRLLGRNNIQLSPATGLGGEIDLQDWQQICRGMLDRQIQFPTLNDLMAKDGVRVDPTLFVPVGLVERKQKQYQRFDVGSAKQGSQLLQPIEEEILKRFDDEEDFFSQVICNSDISNYSRLVVIGEPGAGKTTLLQKMGDRLCRAGMFPIWVSLGRNRVPPTYEILSRILKESTQPQNVGALDWDASINALLQTGRVWLLLDGADELTTNGNPLRTIRMQLREAWANQVKVILTCRLNAWDTYALPEFKVFRSLEFDYQTPVDGYPNQVEAYIHQFFTKDGVDPQLGNALIGQLYMPGKERIRDSVKNPLRLALLCYVWESGIGKLPDARAELYQLFVDYYYDLQELKDPELKIDRTERNTLNQALGEVAKAALDSHDSRFRLRKSLIETIPTMGKSDAKDSLFDKAVQLGWLNLIGTTIEEPHEAAYAFLHPTFQEYFAALSIEDWDDFLPRNHVDKPTRNHKGECKYRIFEAQWKEVILLWLELSENRLDIEKKEFINKLTNFEDGYQNLDFYRLQAYFLAATSVLERLDDKQSNKIAREIMDYSFGYVDNSYQWLEYPEPIAEMAREVLQQTKSDKIALIVIQHICNSDTLLKRGTLYFDEFQLLRKICFKNDTIIQALEEMMIKALKRMTICPDSRSISILHYTSEVLGELDPENLISTESIKEKLRLSEDDFNTCYLAVCLSKISPSSSVKAIKILIRICETTEMESIRWIALESLGAIWTNKDAVRILLKYIESPTDYTCLSAAESLEHIWSNNPKLIKALPKVTEILVKRIQTAKEDRYDLRSNFAECLVKIGLNSPDRTTKEFFKLLNSTKDDVIRFLGANALRKFNINKSRVISELENLTESGDESIQWKASNSLLEEDSSNKKAISTLKQLMRSAKHESTRQLSAESI